MDNPIETQGSKTDEVVIPETGEQFADDTTIDQTPETTDDGNYSEVMEMVNADGELIKAKFDLTTGKMVEVEDTETKETKTEKKEENEDFDFEKLEFESEEGDYSGYDVNAINPNLDLKNEKIATKVSELSEKAKDLGLNDEQFGLLLEASIKPPKKQLSSKDISERLNTQLSRAEKKDYKSVGTFLKNALSGTENESDIKNVMEHPGLYKFARNIYNSINSGKKPVTPEIRTQPKNSDMVAVLDFDGARDLYINKLQSGVSPQDAISEILPKVKDKREFSSFFKIPKGGK